MQWIFYDRGQIGRKGQLSDNWDSEVKGWHRRSKPWHCSTLEWVVCCGGCPRPCWVFGSLFSPHEMPAATPQSWWLKSPPHTAWCPLGESGVEQGKVEGQREQLGGWKDHPGWTGRLAALRLACSTAAEAEGEGRINTQRDWASGRADLPEGSNASSW